MGFLSIDRAVHIWSARASPVAFAKGSEDCRRPVQPWTTESPSEAGNESDGKIVRTISAHKQAAMSMPFSATKISTSVPPGTNSRLSESLLELLQKEPQLRGV